MFAQLEYRNLAIAFTLALQAWGNSVPIGIKPPESMTKVKRVMVYDYVAGWVHVEGISAANQVIAELAQKKGFECLEVNDYKKLTLEFLKGFDVVIWNNNFDALRSVPDSSRREDLLEYIRQGGGWVGVHGAMDGGYDWPNFEQLIGASHSRWNGAGETADLVIDGEALNHPELKFTVVDFPPLVKVLAESKARIRTLRGIQGITIGATIQKKNLIANEDGITEQAIWWARSYEKGRMFMNDLGHFSRDYAVSDSFAVRALWEQMRYAAGDYQNGCTDPSSDYFNPDARVNDGSCENGVPISIFNSRMHFGKEGILQLEGLHPSKFNLPLSSEKTWIAELFDLKGKVVWSRHLTAKERIVRPAGLKPGVYLLQLRNGRSQMTHRVVHGSLGY